MAAVLRSNGIDAEALPVSDRESLELGRQFTTGKECYPCILTTGDIIKQTRQPDFDPERASFFMAQAHGPCRFGQYHKFHRMVLDELGYQRVPMVVLDQTHNFSDQVDSFGATFYRRCWDLLVIVDYMQKMVREIRPYEANEGETDEVYQRGLERLVEVAESEGDYFAAAREIRRRLQAVRTGGTDARPVIGVVGEIYVRSNEFANNFLVRKLEGLGAQVMLPTLQEWINYIAHERRALCWQSTQLLSLLKEWIGELVARWAESRVARIFEGAIQHMPREEPSSRVIELGSRYLDPSVKGEAILSMGRAVEYARHGLNGVVNVAPFGCMPGALVNGLLEEFRGEYDGIPVLKLAFDGVEQTAEDTLLEAFVHQALQHKGSRSAGESPGAAANTS
ncbi:MAG: hypothetical protein PVJ27_08410, partial [Candidatus Brocadiaceae bacterium]|jgi:predicted nucleotide-binding protein (sugar kinase/HSP70/actin superfamily)